MRITFNALRIANKFRLPTFKDAKGNRVHTQDDGSDWPMSKWNNAVLGELGEAANIIKKIERWDFGRFDPREERSRLTKEQDDILRLLAFELADVVTYIDLLAYQARIDLGKAIAIKFNLVSNRVGSPVIFWCNRDDDCFPVNENDVGTPLTSDINKANLPTAYPEKIPDVMAKQATEFDTLAALMRAYRQLPAVVDDDYPEMRHYYETALYAFVRALRANGRLDDARGRA